MQLNFRLQQVAIYKASEYDFGNANWKCVCKWKCGRNEYHDGKKEERPINFKMQL